MSLLLDRRDYNLLCMYMNISSKHVSKIIYEMNKLAKIEIRSPNGINKEILVNDIVRQRPIFGPKLCCVSTQNVNNLILPMKTVISPEIVVEAPVHVDDILGVGNKDTVEKAIKNTSILEKEGILKLTPRSQNIW